MRDAVAFVEALLLVIGETRKAFLRNSHKKDPAQESPGFLWEELRKEVDEAHKAWLNEGEERFLEEVGDVAMYLVALVLQGAYQKTKAVNNYHLGGGE